MTFETIDVDLKDIPKESIIALVKAHLKSRIEPASFSLLEDADYDNLDFKVFDAVLNDVLLAAILQEVERKEAEVAAKRGEVDVILEEYTRLKNLLKFYGTNDVITLASLQAKHVERLQEKLHDYTDRQYRTTNERVREG